MNKKIDLLVVSLILVIMGALAHFLRLNPLVIGSGLYLLTPSFYLILREKKNLRKIFLIVMIVGVIFSFICDFIGIVNKAWAVQRTVFPWKVLGIVPVDDILWAMFVVFFIVVFYEHFLDDEKDRRVSRNLKWALALSIIGLIFIAVVFLINSGLLRVPYAYLAGGILIVIFPLVFCAHKREFLSKFLKMGAYFFFVWLGMELFGLKSGGWYFPGQYIGWVKIFGVEFPFEELFFFVMLFASSLVSYYEFFIDDSR